MGKVVTSGDCVFLLRRRSDQAVYVHRSARCRARRPARLPRDWNRRQFGLDDVPAELVGERPTFVRICKRFLEWAEPGTSNERRILCIALWTCGHVDARASG